jgi:hypothetical protein
MGARQHDQAVRLRLAGMQRRGAGGQRLEPFGADLGAALVLVGEPGLRQQLAQLQVAGVVLGQQQRREGRSRLSSLVIQRRRRSPLDALARPPVE